MNRTAAFIGPMVWEEEGPTPILKMSKMDWNMALPWRELTWDGVKANGRKTNCHSWHFPVSQFRYGGVLLPVRLIGIHRRAGADEVAIAIDIVDRG